MKGSGEHIGYPDWSEQLTLFTDVTHNKKMTSVQIHTFVIGRSDGAFVSLCLLFSTISSPLTGLFGQEPGSEALLGATCF